MKSQESLSDQSFFEEMKDVKPFKQDKIPNVAKPVKTLAQHLKRQSLEREQQKSLNYLSMEGISPIAVEDPISYKNAGVQDGVFKKLRLGKYKIDRVLALQTLSLQQAKEALFEGLFAAQREGARTLLIRHGIGQHSHPFPAAMKSYLYHWLKQIPEVLAFYTASKQHGGMAAVYVMLKKHPEHKLHNREIHRKQ